jgi:hypothetical protein
LAEFWNECDLVASLSIFVDEKRLVWLIDRFVVAGLVVVFVGNL